MSSAVTPPDITLCDEEPWGFGWISASPRFMQRASHALHTAEGVWLIDPVDFDGLDARIAALGRPAGVIQLLDRHNRDCAAVSARLGVPIWIAPPAGPLPGSPFEIVDVRRSRHWQECALWWPEQQVLAVAEIVGTPPYYRAAGESLGVHPLLRWSPPRALDRFDPVHILCGHGAGIHDHAPAALHAAIDRARANIVRLAPRLLTFLRR